VSTKVNKVTAAGLLVALGIIYGDIGTSPLYVFNAIINSKEISELLVVGGLSCIIWTLTLQTTLKYVVLTLRADNKGEGGIFSLYTLVRRQKKWLVIPAMIGGAALLADGMITPAISVASSIEGLKQIDAFKNAMQKRAENIAKKKEDKLIQSAKLLIEKQQKVQVIDDQTDSEPEPEPVKKSKSKKKIWPAAEKKIII
jgi:hypothetical protein